MTDHPSQMKDSPPPSSRKRFATHESAKPSKTPKSDKLGSSFDRTSERRFSNRLARSYLSHKTVTIGSLECEKTMSKHSKKEKVQGGKQTRVYKKSVNAHLAMQDINYLSKGDQTTTEENILTVHTLPIENQVKDKLQLPLRNKHLHLVCHGSNFMNQMAFYTSSDFNSLQGDYHDEDEEGDPFYCLRINGLDPLATTKICIGSCSSAALCAGSLFTWGDDEVLGRKVPRRDEVTDQTVAATPTALDIRAITRTTRHEEDFRVIDVASGSTHFVALTEGGHVFMYGRINCNNRKVFHRLEPCFVPALSNIVKVTAGGTMCAALDSMGKLYTWGIGECGQLGCSDNIRALLLDENGGDLELDEERLENIKRHILTPTFPTWEIDASREIIDVACGAYHLLVVARQGSRLSVYSCGLNCFGQLGHGHEDNLEKLTLIKSLEGKNIMHLSAGENFSCFLDETKTQLYTCGYNPDGQLGRFDHYVESDPIPGIVTFTDAEGKGPSDGFRILQVEAGERYVLALTTSADSQERRVYTWGKMHRHDGFGSEMNHLQPVLLHVCEGIQSTMHIHQVSAGEYVSGFLGEMHGLADDNICAHENDLRNDETDNIKNSKRAKHHYH